MHNSCKLFNFRCSLEVKPQAFENLFKSLGVFVRVKQFDFLFKRSYFAGTRKGG